MSQDKGLVNVYLFAIFRDLYMTPNDHINYDSKNSTNVATEYYAWQNQNHMTIYTSRIEMFAIL